MVGFVAPGFQVGDRAFLVDGRSGTITASRFNEEDGIWDHLLDTTLEFHAEFDLFRELQDGAADELPPLTEEELPFRPIISPAGEFVTPDEMREFVVALLRLEPPAGVTTEQLQAAIIEGIERSNLIAQGNLLTHIADAEGKALDVELFTAARFSELESAVTTTLSDIEKRSTDLEAAAEESSGFGFFGFVGGLGGLLKDPVTWIMSRLGDHISSEVNDGLNR